MEKVAFLEKIEEQTKKSRKQYVMIILHFQWKATNNFYVKFF
jgi:hypothetical protein